MKEEHLIFQEREAQPGLPLHPSDHTCTPCRGGSLATRDMPVETHTSVQVYGDTAVEEGTCREQREDD